MRDPVLIDEHYFQQGVDASADTAREIALEDLQDEIKHDPKELVRLALLYAGFHSDDFFGWAAKLLLDERTPEHSRAWENEPC